MDYSSRIATLTESVKVIEKQIAEATDPGVIQVLNSKKSTYESEIRRLIRVQFEEDTQRVRFDEDR
jgi:hypothetical protein